MRSASISAIRSSSNNLNSSASSRCISIFSSNAACASAVLASSSSRLSLASSICVLFSSNCIRRASSAASICRRSFSFKSFCNNRCISSTCFISASASIMSAFFVNAISIARACLALRAFSAISASAANLSSAYLAILARNAAMRSAFSFFSSSS